MDYTIADLKALIKRHDEFEDYYLGQLIRVVAQTAIRDAVQDETLRLAGHSGISVRKLLARADGIEE